MIMFKIMGVITSIPEERCKSKQLSKRWAIPHVYFIVHSIFF